MPYQFKKPCRCPGCPKMAAVGGRYCPQHEKAHQYTSNQLRYPCKHPGCPVLTSPGEYYCKAHHTERPKPARKDRRKSASKRGYDRHWRKIRRAILAEKPLCGDCQVEGRTELAVDIHHIKPLTAGGTHARDNLVPVCKRHHGIRERQAAKLARRSDNG